MKKEYDLIVRDSSQVAELITVLKVRSLVVWCVYDEEMNLWIIIWKHFSFFLCHIS